MTYRDENHVSLASSDWVKLAVGALLQGALLITGAYLAIDRRVSVLETELRGQAALVDEKLSAHRVAIAELKDEVREIRRANGLPRIIHP